MPPPGEISTEVALISLTCVASEHHARGITERVSWTTAWQKQQKPASSCIDVVAMQKLKAVPHLVRHSHSVAIAALQQMHRSIVAVPRLQRRHHIFGVFNAASPWTHPSDVLPILLVTKDCHATLRPYRGHNARLAKH